MTYGMNPQRARHMGQESGREEAAEGKTPDNESHESAGGHPHIFIHSHAKGHTVHIHHPDGSHSKHEHSAGDSEGIAAHIHEHIGGQDHGYSSGTGEEDEHGFGPGV